MSLSSELYKEVIIDHSSNPRNSQALAKPTVSEDGLNPLCGDECHLELRIDSNRIAQVGITGESCSICKASGSIMSESIEGLSVEQTRELVHKFRQMLLDEEKVDFPDDLEEIQALEGVKSYPVRIKCALLAWNTLNTALDKSKSG
jgi:nitrogen fixation NifU-like protein